MTDLLTVPEVAERLRVSPEPKSRCPYKPFGLPCTKLAPHGSPHNIDVEAAYVEKFKADIRERALAHPGKPG